MVSLYENDEEQRQHSGAIHFLASYHHLDEGLVRGIYEDNLKKIKSNARIKTYLSVLTIRQVNDLLHQSHFGR